MKITKRKLIKLIRESFIGYPDKPPVSAKKYLEDLPLPEEYEEFRPQLDTMIKSKDKSQQASGLELLCVHISNPFILDKS